MATSDPMQIASSPVQSPTTPVTAPKAPTALPVAPKAPSAGPTDQPTTQPVANPVTPPPLSTNDPMAFAPPSSGGLPSGFTLGTGAQYGNAFSGGQQLNGLVADNSSPTGYSYSFVNGTTQPGATQDSWQSIINAENQNYYDQGNPGNPAAGAMVQASMPLNGGINGGGLGGPNDAGVGLPPGYVAPHLPTPAANPTAAPSGPSSDFTTYNPMQIAGTSPTPASDVPQSAPPASSPPNSGFVNGITGSTGNQSGVSLTPTDPNNALTSQTISANPTADFLSNAKTQYEDWQKATDPQYQAELRDANRYNFAQGRGISGIATNSLGDIASQRDAQQRAAESSFLYPALQQENANQYANIGIAEQQQGFQNQQQNQAFSQALQQLLAGSSGDPSQIALVLSQIFGSQAGGISNAASNYAANSNAANSSAINNQQFMTWLQSILGGSGATGGLPANFPTTANLPGVQTTPGGGY